MKMARALMNNPARALPLLYATPAAIAVLLIKMTMQSSLIVPVPFFTIIVCVMFAGSFGGVWAGSLAAVIASGFVVDAHFQDFGPATLTGSVGAVVFGITLFMLVGVLLGRLKDQRDRALGELQTQRDRLALALDSEAAENVKATAEKLTVDARLQNAVRIAGIGHFSFSTKTGDCLFCSVQHAAHFGLTPDEFIAVTAGLGPQLRYVHEDDRDMVAAAIANIDLGKPQVFEYRAVRPDGEIRHIREMEEPILNGLGQHTESIGTSIDLTDLRKAESRLRQSQKIEALGTLTGGVAHDFNNLSAVILGNLELALEQGPTDDWEDLVNEAVRATKRGAELTKNLLSFSRRAHLEPTRLNLNTVIQTTLGWAGRVLPANIDVETSFMADLWDVELDIGSAENAVVNILLNARDAMPDGGKITIETLNMRIGDDGLAGRNDDVEPGDYVMLAITDTGKGIELGNLDAIFEPFFTDKPVGKGSGLGLSMVQGFVRQSGGAIRVYSQPGIGTTFKLYFKALARGTVDIAPPEYVAHLAASGRAEVLLVEDEVAVMMVVRRILETAGYAVTAASSADEALEVFKGFNHFDLMVTDVVMPGRLQGPELAKEIRKHRPTFPCIFMSGYSDEGPVHGDRFLSSDIRLTKPVGRNDLLQAVAQALAKRQDA